MSNEYCCNTHQKNWEAVAHTPPEKLLERLGWVYFELENYRPEIDWRQVIEKDLEIIAPSQSTIEELRATLWLAYNRLDQCENRRAK
jgi:hypothetical protein